jgi:hypothetical protein
MHQQGGETKRTGGLLIDPGQRHSPGVARGHAWPASRRWHRDQRGHPLVILGVIAAIVVGYLRLLANRADAVAMAHHRRLAGDAVASQQQLRTELAKLTDKVEAVEQLTREVG